MKWLVTALLWPAALIHASAWAHEIRPAYLEISELPQGGVEVTWRIPVAGEMALPISPWLSSGLLEREPTVRSLTSDALTHIWRIPPPHAPLAGQQVRIRGLDRTITDVFLRIRDARGEETTGLIKAARPTFTIAGAKSPPGVSAYFRLGGEHIALGFDHLLYLFALLLLIERLPMLITAVSAFTLAHSITLAGAALGIVRLKPAPVDAVIALSIAFVAAQLVQRLRGRSGTAQRYPWLVALLFGLLHGFGFAGALRQVGLPDAQIVGALLLFNLGIEAGQLLFVVLVFALLQGLRRRLPRVYQSAMAPMSYVIGSIAAYWLVQRVAAFT